MKKANQQIDDFALKINVIGVGRSREVVSLAGALKKARKQKIGSYDLIPAQTCFKARYSSDLSDNFYQAWESRFRKS